MSDEITPPVVVENTSPVAEGSSEVVETQEVAAPEGNEYVKSFERLSKREAAVRAQQEDLKKYQTQAKELELLKSSVKDNPIEALQNLGLTMEDLLTIALGEDIQEEQAPTEELSVEEQLKALKEEFKSLKDGSGKSNEVAELEEDEEKLGTDTHSESEVIDSYIKEIDEFIQSEPSKYKLTSTMKAQDLIWEVTQAQFDETGELLELEAAASMVEDYLKQQAETLLGVLKPEQQVEETTERTKPKPMNTLSSKHVTQSAESETQTGTADPMEARRRALALAEKIK